MLQTPIQETIIQQKPRTTDDENVDQKSRKWFTTKSIQQTVSKKYVLKNYIQQKCIRHKPNLYIIINVCNKNVDNKNVCKVHKRRYIEQKRIDLCSIP